MKRYIFITMFMIIATVLVACGDDKDEPEEAENGLPPMETEISDEEKVDEEEVVAVVNGEEVTGLTYNLIYAQLKLQAVQMEEDFSLEEIKEATMDSLIDQEIVIQEAKEEGIEITPDIAAEEFNKLKKENGDDLDTLLDQYQITEDGFKEQLRFELTMNEYLTEAIEVEVTDDEVKQTYEDEKAKADNGDEMPEFDEVKDQIKGNLREEKTTLALQEKVDKVKETSEIERKI